RPRWPSPATPAIRRIGSPELGPVSRDLAQSQDLPGKFGLQDWPRHSFAFSTRRSSPPVTQGEPAVPVNVEEIRWGRRCRTPSRSFRVDLAQTLAVNRPVRPLVDSP